MDNLEMVSFPNEEAIEGTVFDQWGIAVTAILTEDNELIVLPF